MAQRPQQASTLAQLAGLRRVESILAAILLVVAAVATILYQQVTAKQERLMTIERQVASARAQLQAAFSQNTEEELRAELARLRAEMTATSSLPTEAGARYVGTMLVSHASQRDISIITFDDAQERAQVGGIERPVVRYSLNAEGDVKALIETFRVLQSVPSVVVEELTLDRSDEIPDEWTFELETAVFFTEAR